MPSFSFWVGLAQGVGLALALALGVGPQRIGASAVDRDGRGQLLAPRHIHAKSPINGTRSACELHQRMAAVELFISSSHISNLPVEYYIL